MLDGARTATDKGEYLAWAFSDIESLVAVDVIKVRDIKRPLAARRAAFTGVVHLAAQRSPALLLSELRESR
jgi:hypothetical protein